MRFFGLRTIFFSFFNPNFRMKSPHSVHDTSDMSTAEHEKKMNAKHSKQNDQKKKRKEK